METEHDVESLGATQPAEAGRRRRWRPRHVVAAVGAFIVVAAVIATFIQLPYYAITPGSAPMVAGLIRVPAADLHSHRGSVLLVYVEITPIRAIEYPYFWLDSNAAIVSSAAVLGSESTAQYQTEGEIDMATAQQAATVVALRELGYKVPVSALGALVYGVLPGSPAEASLAVGDVISAVDGHKVNGFIQLEQHLELMAPGSTVHLSVSSYPASNAHDVAVRLGVFRVEGTGPTAPLECFRTGAGTRYPPVKAVTVKGEPAHTVGCLGIYPQGSGGPAVDGTAYRIGKLPVAVDLSSEGIVGPSAGLAFTLGLIEALDPADLTGGLKVAATGTMSIDGSVGDVGGVAQKTVAVRNAGASVFLVPVQEYAVARAKAGPNLKVFAVSSIAQAIGVLERLGGHLQRRAAG